GSVPSLPYSGVRGEPEGLSACPASFVRTIVKSHVPGPFFEKEWAMSRTFPTALGLALFCGVLALPARAQDPGAPVPPPFPGPFPGMNSPAKELVPDLIKVLKDDDAEVREAVGEALANIGHDAVPGLVTLFKSKDKADRVLAAQILGEMGWQAQEALPVLVKALKDKDAPAPVRRAAAKAVSLIVKNPYGAVGGRGGFGGFGVVPAVPVQGGVPADPPVETERKIEKPRPAPAPAEKPARIRKPVDQ